MTFQRVKGTEDFYPKEFALRKRIYEILAETASKFGFQQVDMPAIETIKLLTAKSGEETKQQIFVLEKRGTEEFGLRFDLTVPITRMFVVKQRELPKPVKWFAVEPMWRYEAPQKGRQREFVQLSVELFGSDKPQADAQCIQLVIACLNAFGLTNKDFAIKINNRKLLEGILEEISPKQVQELVALIDRSGKLSSEELSSEFKKLKLSDAKQKEIKEIIAGKSEGSIPKIVSKLKLNEKAKQGLEELKKTLEFTDSSYILVDLSIARGLAYYTGNVFECFDKEGKFRAIAGGGRYDNLVELFDGEKTPATGFAIGAETLILLLTEKGLLPEISAGPDYYIAPISTSVYEKASEIAKSLRKKYSVDIDIMERGLSKQLDYASSIGARKVVIVGEKDLKEGKVTIKDLKSGKEEKVKFGDL